eukprot:69577-Chlamydomonas_euryale.AAC.2
MRETYVVGDEGDLRASACSGLSVSGLLRAQPLGTGSAVRRLKSASQDGIGSAAPQKRLSGRDRKCGASKALHSGFIAREEGAGW